MTPALSIKNLRKTFRPRGGTELLAVDNLDLAIAPGEIFVLLGPNGAGKSTTINIVVGVTNKSSGDVAVFGYDVEKEYATTRRLVGVVPQEINFDPFFSTRDVLEIQSGLMGVPKKDWWIDEIMERLSLTAHQKKNTRELSGGMKRRLMVAKALVHRPQLLILDEPTAGVDIELRRQLWDFVLELKDKGTTILLTTHYLEEAEKVGERVGLIHHGRIKEIDTIAELKRKHESKTLEDVYLKLTSDNNA